MTSRKAVFSIISPPLMRPFESTSGKSPREHLSGGNRNELLDKPVKLRIHRCEQMRMGQSNTDNGNPAFEEQLEDVGRVEGVHPGVENVLDVVEDDHLHLLNLKRLHHFGHGFAEVENSFVKGPAWPLRCPEAGN